MATDKSPTIFISYSHLDEKWKDRLKPFLKGIAHATDDKIVVWDDRKIDAGDKWYPEIRDALSRAAVAVCLVSEHFLASDFCVKEEVCELLKRHEQEGILLIFVLLRPCPWKSFRWIREHEAGRALLRMRGIRGSDEELERAVRQFGNHALALNLFGVLCS